MEVADGLLSEAERAAKRLGQYPLMGRPREELAPGLRSILAHPHVLFYRVTDQTVEIARVLHERRDLAAIFARGPERGREHD
jgi:toxin ParE1/3/4